MIKILTFYFLFLNLAALFLMASDKTRKPLFRFGIPAVILIQIFVVAFLLYHQNIGSFY